MSIATATTDVSVQTKLERQKLKLVDRPGQLCLVHKNELHIDPVYQREASPYRVQIIAKNWSWVSCGVITVASRSGKHFVIDGGHRVLAAKDRPEITFLPCIVFATRTDVEEARGFLDVNTQRRSMHSVDRFKALVIVGDSAALALKSLFEQYGYHTNPCVKHGSMGSVGCVGTLLECYQMDPECFLRVWPLLMDTLRGRSIHERVAASIFYAELAASKHGLTITKNPWSGRVIRLGLDGVLASANKASAYFARGGMKVWAKGLVDALNHGTRNKLEIIDIETKKVEADE